MSDLSVVRDRFPSLQREMGKRRALFADGPAGTQVPESVIDAVASYYRSSNANSGGAFVTSAETDNLVGRARAAGAAFLGAEANEIAFGANMTTLAYALSRSLAQELGPGDEIVVTKLDHDANISPWLAAAEESGATVRWVEIRPDDCTLDLASLDAALSERTRIVAVTLASNAVGTVTPVSEIVERVRGTDAIVIADAVHFAPHRPIDVSALGVDVLLCSPYKFFGPHMGVMWARRELLDSWPAYRVRPASNDSPDRWESGTRNNEALAGFIATIDYLAGLGTEFAGASGSLRARVAGGMEAVRDHEQALSRRFLAGVRSNDGVRLFGIGDLERVAERTPTFAVRVRDRHPRATAEALGEQGIFVWDGNYYALAVMEALGLEGSGGAVRIGFCHYNTADEVDRVLEALEGLVAGPFG